MTSSLEYLILKKIGGKGMKLKRLTALLLTVVMVLGMTTGCGKKETGKSVDAVKEETEEGTEETKEEPKKLTITVWDNDTSPQFSAVVEGFKKLHPDVEIELVDTAASDYDDKLTVMLAIGDSDPDVIFVKDAETQTTMKEKGQLLNLDEFIAKDNLDLSIYNGIAEQLKMDGSTFSLPYRSDWYLLYYNKDLFDKVGVDYPGNDMTWKEYEELAKKMTSGEGSQKVYGTHNHTWMALVANWALQDGKHTLADGKYDFLKDVYTQALRLQDEGIVQSYANLKTGNIAYASVFQQEQCAMLPMGSWFIGTMITAINNGEADFNWGIATIPHPEGVEAGNTVGSTTPIAINSATDAPELAWEFVKYATSLDAAKLLAEQGIFPAAQSDDILDTLTKVEGMPEGSKEALAVKSLIFDRPLDPKMASIRKVIEEEHDLIMIEEEDVETGIANMNKRVEEIEK